jgi:hypothetical protein
VVMAFLSRDFGGSPALGKRDDLHSL